MTLYLPKCICISKINSYSECPLLFLQVSGGHGRIIVEDIWGKGHEGLDRLSSAHSGNAESANLGDCHESL